MCTRWLQIRPTCIRSRCTPIPSSALIGDVHPCKWTSRQNYDHKTLCASLPWHMLQIRQFLSVGARIDIHYISACASARYRRFTSIRECISALKHWLHAHGVIRTNDRTRWALFLGIASGKHNSHTCSYIWSQAMRFHTKKPPYQRVCSNLPHAVKYQAC